MQQKYLDTIEFWLEYLTREEIAFVLMFLKDTGSPLVTIFEGMGHKEQQDDAPDDDDTSVDFESNLILKSHEKDLEHFTVFLSGSYSGYFSGGSPGTYWDPPEAADFTIDDVTVETIAVGNTEGDLDDVEKSNVDGKNLGFTYDNLVCSAASMLTSYVPGDTSVSVDKYIKANRLKEIPPQLMKKIEEIYDKNYDSFKYKMAGKKYGV
jgi:hypothetical protein